MKEKILSLSNEIDVFLRKQSDVFSSVPVCDLLRHGDFLLGCDRDNGRVESIAYVPNQMPLVADVIFSHDEQARFAQEDFLEAVANFCFEKGAVKVKLLIIVGTQDSEPVAGFELSGLLKKEALFKENLSDIVILERIHPGLEESVAEEVAPVAPSLPKRNRPSRRRKKVNV